MVFGIAIGAGFFVGYNPVQIALSILGILLFVGVFALGFLFLSAGIAVSMETPEGMQGIMTLMTMPIFFASNALYPINAFPETLRLISTYNPMTLLINGIRYFAIGPDFLALGEHYMYTSTDILLSFTGLLAFAVIMYAFARWRFNKAVVT
jgi:ABC-2 type transport system permease protein